jgi:signal transduction histidine kinase
MIEMSMDIRMILVKPILEDTVKAFRSRFKDQQINIDLDITDHEAMIQADPERFTQVFTSILNNAVVFSGRGGHVTVKLLTDDYVRIIVEDNGIGIPPAELPHVFDKFFRGDNPITREYPGYGLGLYIARYLTRQMKGRILAFSDSGNGSRFEVLMPQ